MDYEHEHELDHDRYDALSFTDDDDSARASDTYKPRASRANRPRRGTNATDNTDFDLLLLTEQVQDLRRELEQERRQRQEDVKLAHRAIQRVYNDCTALSSRESSRLSAQEQKVENLTGRYRNCHEDLKAMKKSLETLLSTAASLRTRIEEIERRNHAHAKPEAPQVQIQHAPVPKVEHATPTDHEPRQSLQAKSRNTLWTAQVIFVLDAARPNVFEVDGVHYLKLQSRSSRQKVDFSSDSSLSFVLGIESSFPTVLRNRTWMPLASHRLADNGGNTRITLDRLTSRQRESDLWDREFLEKHCITFDAAGKAHVYIALTQGELTLGDVHGIPRKTEQRSASRQPTSNPPAALKSPRPILSPNASGQPTARHSQDLMRPRLNDINSGSQDLMRPKLNDINPGSQDLMRPRLNDINPGKAHTSDALQTLSPMRTRTPREPYQLRDGDRTRPYKDWAVRPSTTRPPFETNKSSGANTALGLVIPPRLSSKKKTGDNSIFGDWGDWKRGGKFWRNTASKAGSKQR